MQNNYYVTFAKRKFQIIVKHLKVSKIAFLLFPIYLKGSTKNASVHSLNERMKIA